MNIVVIGCDATGKSTLIELLKRELKLNVKRGSSFELSNGKSNQELFETFLELTKEDNTIFDRFAYCNYVYADLYEDYSRLTVNQVRFIEREMLGDALVIYLSAPKEVIKNRFETRGEDYVDESKILPIKIGYSSILEDSILPILRFDTSILNSDEIVKSVINYLIK